MLKKYSKGGTVSPCEELFVDKEEGQEIVGDVVMGAKDFERLARAAEESISSKDFQRSLLNFDSINALGGVENE